MKALTRIDEAINDERLSEDEEIEAEFDITCSSGFGSSLPAASASLGG